MLTPRYLKSATYYNSVLLHLRLPLQFTNIYFVFSVLITRLFMLQKVHSLLSRSYNYKGEGAISARSSANASMYSCIAANVYNISYYVSIYLLLQYCLIKGYTLSINITNNVGEAPSPYLTPMFVKKSCITLVLLSWIVPRELIYIFFIIYTIPYGICSS
jgi:hypothetical protein